MSNIVNDAVDYDIKLSLIRAYSSRYTSDDFARIFGSDSLTFILENYTYSVIRSRLMNSVSNTVDGDISIGDIVIINKPVKKDEVYIKINGMVIGKYIVYDEYNNNINPIYHYVYDILVQVEYYTDGYKYEIRRESGNDLEKTDYHIDGVDDIMQELSYKTVSIDINNQ